MLGALIVEPVFELLDIVDWLYWPLLTAYPQKVRGISLEEPPY